MTVKKSITCHGVSSDKAHTFVVEAEAHGVDGRCVHDKPEAHLIVNATLAPYEVGAAVNRAVDACRDDAVARKQLEGRSEDLASYSPAVEAVRLRQNDPSPIRTHHLHIIQIIESLSYQSIDQRHYIGDLAQTD